MTTATEELLRVQQMLSGLTVSMPIMLMSSERVAAIVNRAASDQALSALNDELRKNSKR